MNSRQNTTLNTEMDPIGILTLQPLDAAVDAKLLAGWLRDPKSVYWMQPNATEASVRAEYEALQSNPHRHAYLGHHNGNPQFLVETYLPEHSELAGTYPIDEGDIGMHVLVAPTTLPKHGFTKAVMTTVMEFLFTVPTTKRVVVEPDIDNTAIHKLNSWVGFTPLRSIPLQGKTALLSLCTRTEFNNSAAFHNSAASIKEKGQ